MNAVGCGYNRCDRMLSMSRAAFSAAGVALVLLFGALRNIPAAPFSWLTP